MTLRTMPPSTFADRPAFVMTEREIEWRRLRSSSLGADVELAAEIAASNVDVQLPRVAAEHRMPARPCVAHPLVRRGTRIESARPPAA